MLCEIAKDGNFFTTWLAMTVIAFVLTMVMSGLLFYFYYWRPTFQRWRRKTNPAYPSPPMVRREVIQMLKGILMATLCPAASLHLVDHGWSQAYCGVGSYGVGWLVASFFIIWIGTDFFEFFYHRLGHTTLIGWKQHKHHHVFYNPSPFAVIADDYVDQLARSAPMLLFPLIMPTNMDLLFFTFGAFFYAYGAYLHWGHEFSWLDAHSRFINTAYHHYIHHARSTLKKPYHTGFFFKLWDRWFGSCYDKRCECVRCATERGERTEELFATVDKPDYSVLLRPRFWIEGGRKTRRAGS